MAFLQLQNVGKIYVSDNNVSVGIRGVNLSFERGEFVAVTGKSGSGKSTLLNVLSGMDSYEEGEMLIEGEPTSHYLQKDWEAYRERYISFIFQDYNIIDSFTVLQNVELALSNIENPVQRRRQAIALLNRVGMGSHLHHKGARLSGGQKQRTVIARALAKDSPIILADEPTGNLDAKSSEEIIELLREVSADKLVIVVTHNFEQVEKCATRHIRIFDGAVESDQVLCPVAPYSPAEDAGGKEPAKDSVKDAAKDAGRTYTGAKKQHEIRNGMALGWVRFASRPFLSAFLCILMTLTTLTITLFTALSGDAFSLFDKYTLFTHIDGRVVVARRDGKVMTDAELEALAEKTGAKSVLHYDAALDLTQTTLVSDGEDDAYFTYRLGYPADSVRLSGGRYPERADEVVMYLPIYLRPMFGDGTQEQRFSLFGGLASYKVVGVSYFYDNTKTAQMLFSEEGFALATMLSMLAQNKDGISYTATLSAADDSLFAIGGSAEHLFVDFEMADGYGIRSTKFEEGYAAACGQLGEENLRVSLKFSGSFRNLGGANLNGLSGLVSSVVSWGTSIGNQVEVSFDDYPYIKELSPSLGDRLEERRQAGYSYYGEDVIVLSPRTFMAFMQGAYYDKSYTQGSLFYGSDGAAKKQITALRDMGYDAMASYETAERDLLESVVRVLTLGLQLLGWFLCVIFVSMFLGLCSTRAMLATKGDIAIMRSMGIGTRVIKISTYVQTMIALIPAFLVTACTCVAIYLTPASNQQFVFLHAPAYLTIGVVLILIAARLSRRYVRKMFHESVRKTLRGGAKGE